MKILHSVWIVVVLSSSSLCLAVSLEQAVTEAFNTHPDLKMAYHAYQRQKQDLRIAKSGWLPSVDLIANSGQGSQDVPESRSGAQEDSIEPVAYNLSMRQLLFDGFITSNNIGKNKRQTQAQFFKLLSEAEKTALDVARVYLGVLEQERIKDLARKNVESHTIIYDQIKQRTQNGLGSSSDFSQASGRLAKARANEITSLNNYHDAVAAYLRVVGLRPKELLSPVADDALLPPSRPKLVKAALAGHPDIGAADLEIDAAEKELKSRKGTYYPKLSFEVERDYSEDQRNENQERKETLAELALTYNLYRGGADRARVKKSIYALESAKESRISILRGIREFAENSWNAYTFTDEQLVFLKEHVEQSYITQQAYKQQFTLGRRTLLDLLDTENELFEARRAYILAEHALLLAKYRVFNSSGKLLESLKVDPNAYWVSQ